MSIALTWLSPGAEVDRAPAGDRVAVGDVEHVHLQLQAAAGAELEPLGERHVELVDAVHQLLAAGDQRHRDRRLGHVGHDHRSWRARREAVGRVGLVAVDGPPRADRAADVAVAGAVDLVAVGHRRGAGVAADRAGR